MVLHWLKKLCVYERERKRERELKKSHSKVFFIECGWPWHLKFLCLPFFFPSFIIFNPVSSLISYFSTFLSVFVSIFQFIFGSCPMYQNMFVAVYADNPKISPIYIAENTVLPLNWKSLKVFFLCFCVCVFVIPFICPSVSGIIVCFMIALIWWLVRWRCKKLKK